jgi:hypothetical protein
MAMSWMALVPREASRLDMSAEAELRVLFWTGRLIRFQPWLIGTPRPGSIVTSRLALSGLLDAVVGDSFCEALLGSWQDVPCGARFSVPAVSITSKLMHSLAVPG